MACQSILCLISVFTFFFIFFSAFLVCVCLLNFDNIQLPWFSERVTSSQHLLSAPFLAQEHIGLQTQTSETPTSESVSEKAC